MPLVKTRVFTYNHKWEKLFWFSKKEITSKVLRILHLTESEFSYINMDTTLKEASDKVANLLRDPNYYLTTNRCEQNSKT